MTHVLVPRTRPSAPAASPVAASTTAAPFPCHAPPATSPVASVRLSLAGRPGRADPPFQE